MTNKGIAVVEILFFVIWGAVVGHIITVEKQKNDKSDSTEYVQGIRENSDARN